MNWKATQNPDGGWAYSRGCSWTEPTVLVLLAQSAIGFDSDCFAAGAKYLRSLEGPDGGWRPQSGVAESTWVTSLVGLLPPVVVGAPRHSRALAWLKDQTGRETSWSFKLRQRLNGSREEFPVGWPWFPGASAWVVPTSLAVLAFERELRIRPDSELSARVAAGKRFLLSHMCADGGWNYGAGRALGVDGDSYPETTGVALLALRGENVGRPIAAAKKHLAACRSAEGLAWLKMGLAAHGQSPQIALEPVCRTNTDRALWAMAQAPVNPLLRP